MIRPRLWIGGLLLGLVGCVPQFETVGCYSTDECPPAFACVDRACVRVAPDRGLPDLGAPDAGLDAGGSADGLSAGGAFGAVITVVGDVNGDGFADVAIAAPSARQAGCAQDCGRVYIYHGGPDGLRLPAVSTIDGVNGLETELGRRMHAPGDVDGDGFADLVLGAREGAVYVIHGSMDGLPSGRVDRVARTTLPPDEPYVVHGDAFDSGDFDADGYPDLAFLSRTYATVSAACERGRATIHQPAVRWTIAPGGPQGIDLERAQTLTWRPDDPALCACPDLSPRPTTCDVGTALIVADFDGDGRDDAAIGAGRTVAGAGELRPYFSRPAGPIAMASVPGRCPQMRLTGARQLHAMGDWEGDGHADVLAVALGRSEDCRTPGPMQLLRLAGGPDGLTRKEALFDAPLDARGVGRIDASAYDWRATRLLTVQSEFDSGDGALRLRVWTADVSQQPSAPRVLLHADPSQTASGGLAFYRPTPESPPRALIGLRPIDATQPWHVEILQLP